MDLLAIVLFVIIGGLAGFIASKLMRGVGLGLLGNVVVGIVGAFLGYFLFALMGVTFGGLFGTLFTATVGALLLLAIVGLFSRNRVYSSRPRHHRRW
jgi:uncharacterized membrane protein YeaQ/YmgE (transglycosylase-associated protein family)